MDARRPHDGGRDRDTRTRRVVGSLVVTALLALPGVAYAYEGLVGRAGSGDPRVVVTLPTPWQAFRAGTTVDLLAEAGDGDPWCEIRWDDGTGVERVPARGGRCAASRVMAEPGMYTLRVAVAGADGVRHEDRTMVVVHDPRAVVAADGVTSHDAAGFRLDASYLPRTRRPAAVGSGAFVTADGLAARVGLVEWVVATPTGAAAVKGTALTADGTPYGFLFYLADGSHRSSTADDARLVVWPLTTGNRPGDHRTQDNLPGTPYDLDQALSPPLTLDPPEVEKNWSPSSVIHHSTRLDQL